VEVRTEYLLDASAIYPLVLSLGERFVDYANKFSILDLTVYEVGNTLVKEFRRGRISNLRVTVELFNEVFSYAYIVRGEIDISKVAELALSEKPNLLRCRLPLHSSTTWSKACHGGQRSPKVLRIYQRSNSS